MAAPAPEAKVEEIVKDPATAANLESWLIGHYDLDATVDFAKSQMACVATMKAERVEGGPAADKIVLDAFHLDVSSVKANGEEVPFAVSEFTPFGKALSMTVGSEVASVDLVITYTAGSGPALVWLKPEQTAGKAKPFLYSQGQACLNRSVLPCADSPSRKVTYAAKLTIPSEYTAVMSADPKGVTEAEGGMKVFSFDQPRPTPIYLMAFAVGDLDSAEIGPRSRVYAEPCLIEKAKYEFGEGLVTEKYVAAGEKLFGTYQWGRYDILVLPPSFPYGGMENVQLTFVTPCLLTGDQSLSDVVAHEISHSWFGNLVTNASWEQFFLNEGFTMYAQRRITTEVHGEAFTALEAKTGMTLLDQCIVDLGEDSFMTRLHVPIEDGVDPDDTYCEVPYEKGYCFVSYLAKKAGGTAAFDDFLKHYVKTYSFKSITAKQMLDCYFDFFPALKEERDSMNLDDWLHKPGYPTFRPDLSAGDALSEPASKLAELWTSGAVAEATAVDIKGWNSYQVFYFMDALVAKAPLTEATMVALDECYKYSAATNAEIRLRWGQLVGLSSFGPGRESVSAFLKSQGKQKYTLPVYRALVAGDEASKAFALATFEETVSALHVSVANYARTILGLERVPV